MTTHRKTSTYWPDQPPNPSGKKSAWDRASLLQHICEKTLARKKRGIPLIESARLFSRLHHGKRLRDGDVLKLSRQSFLRLYGDWIRGGRLRFVFESRYVGCSHAKITADALRVFAKILFRDGTQSCLHAFNLFCRRRRVDFTYSSLMRRFPAGLRKQLAARRKAIADADLGFAKLRIAAEAHALATIPPVRHKRRRNHADEYSI